MSLFHKTDWTNPRAEWHRSGSILMHTPGLEAFDAVIHPAAGLYEDYFDADKVSAEHREYIRRLRAQGITVHTIKEILDRTATDRLRALASRVLTYDSSHLAASEGADMEAYREEVLSKMSRADLIRCILLRPTVTLFDSDQKTGYQAEYSYRPLMNL